MKRNQIRRFLSTALALALAVCLLVPALSVAEASGSTAKGDAKARAARDGVVRVYSPDTGLGSGFAVGEAGKPAKYFVTNWHVVVDDNGNIADEVYLILDDETLARVMTPIDDEYVMFHPEFMDKTHAVRCHVLGSPEQYPDFAVLEAEHVVSERKALPLSKLKTVNPLDTVYAVGFPGVGDALVNEKVVADQWVGPYKSGVDSMSTTKGDVTKIDNVYDFGNLEYIITSCEIHHGNSGGPLLNSNGAVIGITTYGYDLDDQNNVAMYYMAVPIDNVITELDRQNIKYTLDNPTADWLLPTVLVLAAIVAVIVVVVIIVSSNNRKHEQMMAGQARAMEEQARMMEQRMASMQAAQNAQAQQYEQMARNVQAQAQSSDAGYRLVGVAGQFAGRRYAIMGKVRMGTEPAQNHLVFAAKTPGVSRSHCDIRMENGRPYITDRGSTYGTFVNNQKLPPKTPMPLNVGDVIMIGSRDVSFRIEHK